VRPSPSRRTQCPSTWCRDAWLPRTPRRIDGIVVILMTRPYRLVLQALFDQVGWSSKPPTSLSLPHLNWLSPLRHTGQQLLEGTRCLRSRPSRTIR
jgi:hypothetical protein